MQPDLDLEHTKRRAIALDRSATLLQAAQNLETCGVADIALDEDGNIVIKLNTEMQENLTSYQTCFVPMAKAWIKFFRSVAWICHLQSQIRPANDPAPIEPEYEGEAQIIEFPHANKRIEETPEE